jgi:hypothetical protein
VIKFEKKGEQLILTYEPESGSNWVEQKLHDDGFIRIAKIFRFKFDDLEYDYNFRTTETAWSFVLGNLSNGYYQIAARILGLEHDVKLSSQMLISRKTFIAQTSISVFARIATVINQPIIIGDEDVEGCLPISEFEQLLDNFPTSTEMKYYANARVSGVLRDYFDTTSDAQAKLEKYLKKQETVPLSSKTEWLNKYETQKYLFIRETLVEMLANEDSYLESKWQKLIADFLLLIFPKYIAVLQNVPVKDYYSDPTKTIDRYIDIALVDANGNLDIIEVKRPFKNKLLMAGIHRGNHVPQKELSGTVVQVEKYLFHLSKSGRQGEKVIADKYATALPTSLKIQITNPKAMLIIGRDENLTNEQKFDLEIIKRKYANVMDIMTYDDLLRRLDNIIEKYSTK